MNKKKKTTKKKRTVQDKDGHYDIDGVSYKDGHIYLGSDDIEEDEKKEINRAYISHLYSP